MEQMKRKISIRKILQAIVTLIVTTGCAIALLSASNTHKEQPINDLKINIKNEKTCGFLTKNDVQTMLLDNRHITLGQTSMADMNLNRMEAIMRANPWVSEAEVFIDNSNVLHIIIEQRVPAFRVFDQTGNSFYLDSLGMELPLSEKYTHYCAVITNVPELKNDSLGSMLKSQMLRISQAIQSDSFWNTQVSAIKLNDNLTFELIPVIGNHRIYLGDTSALQEKLNHVFAFYKQVFNRIGWDRYQEINVSFRGQIIASPSLPWTPPKDKAMSNMNWVKSIINNAPPEHILKTTPEVVPTIKSTVTSVPVQPAQQKPAVHNLQSDKKITPVATPVTSSAPVEKIKEKKEPIQKGKNTDTQHTPRYIFDGSHSPNQ